MKGPLRESDSLKGPFTDFRGNGESREAGAGKTPNVALGALNAPNATLGAWDAPNATLGRGWAIVHTGRCGTGERVAPQRS
ncbi:hypothetical protein GCM10009565_73910 [Amycolatopsis albidoflavus]